MEREGGRQTETETEKLQHDYQGDNIQTERPVYLIFSSWDVMASTFVSQYRVYRILEELCV